jgi:hypothetical protein
LTGGHLRAGSKFHHVDGRNLDWQLWIERNGRMTSAKCPLHLEIESLLRSWLLRVSGLPLNTLTYTELRLITEGKILEAKRLHVRGHDTLMHRPETSPTPYITAA